MSKMNRIVMHHSGGGLTPTVVDKNHYHRITGGDGKVISGNFPISANAPGRPLQAGKYAAHTRGLNTGAIGCAIAALTRDTLWSKPRACPAFPTSAQLDAFIADVASLARQHGIAVSRQTILSHGEVEITLGVVQAGKWDFDYDPFGVLDTRDPIKIGDMLREKVADAMGDAADIVAPRGPDRVLRRGHVGDDVREAQMLLIKHGAKIAADRMFGPATWTATVAFQRKHELLADGIIGRMTWAALRGE